MFDGLATKVEGEMVCPCLMHLSRIEGEAVVCLKRSGQNDLSVVACSVND